jgi:DNA gyrase subunit A
VKKTPLADFKEVRRNGKIAMDLEGGDEFIAAKLVHEDDEVVMITSNGQATRFPVNELRSASRTSGGVRGIKLAKGGKVVSLEVVTPGCELFSITENGYGKRTPFEDYPAHHRGGQGVRNYEITKKTGPVVASRTVNAAQELIVISKDGIVIRTRMDSIRMTGRAAQGVSVISVGQGDIVASLATIDMGADKPGSGDDGRQQALEGLDADVPPAVDENAKPASRKPTPIRRDRPVRAAAPPPPKKSVPAAKKPPLRAPAKPKTRPAAKTPPAKAKPAAKRAVAKPAAKKATARAKPATKKPAKATVVPTKPARPASKKSKRQHR